MIKVDKGNFSAEGNLMGLNAELAIAIQGIFDSAAKVSQYVAVASVSAAILTAASEIEEKYNIDILEFLKEECK